MNAGTRTNKPGTGAWMGLAGLMVLMAVPRGQAETVLSADSLGAVEYRALMAQSLTQQVESMRKESEGLRQQLSETEAKLSEAQDQLDLSRNEARTLQQSLAELAKEVEKREQLLAVFRRGSFEYYEVRAGDTLDSIASNPMVYGDPERAIWLRQANSLANPDALEPGTVLIVPRFPEGTSYDL